MKIVAALLAMLLWSVAAHAQDSIVMCGDGSPPCGTSSDITGGLISGNVVRFGAGQGCVFAASPVVTVGSNTCGLVPEVVVSVTFPNGADIQPLTPNQPNAVVATLAVNMSDVSWAFPFPPGTLSIGGTNSGNFAICNQNQICQPAGGTPAGTYKDFTITATLHGMSGSPFTMPAGSLTIASGFYVATNGNDSNPGTLASPFATLRQCQIAVRPGPSKACFTRGGSYALTSSSCADGTCLLSLSASDNNEIWAYYPPDGVDSASFGGGSTSSSTGTQIFIDITTLNGLTIDGLTCHHFQFQCIIADASGVQTVSPNNISIRNNILHDNFTNNRAMISLVNVQNSSVTHNVVYNTAQMGIGLLSSWIAGYGNIRDGSLNGDIVENNLTYATCLLANDCGGLYFSDGPQLSTTPPVVEFNYVRDVTPASANNAGNSIYNDDCSFGMTQKFNVLTGHMGQAMLNHGGPNNIFSQNVIDLTSYGTQTNGEFTAQLLVHVNGSNVLNCGGGASKSTSAGVQINQNVVISNTHGGGGQVCGVPSGFTGGAITVQNGDYFAYSGATPISTQVLPNGPNCTGSYSDTSPQNFNPQLSGCYLPSPLSPIFSTPVSWPALPANWGQPGFWGPPGFTVPATEPAGSIPSYPSPNCTASGDPPASLMPPERDASRNWQMAGLASIGGIPNRTTQCGSTVNPIGGGSDNTANIQAAINACAAGDFVSLACGIFIIAEGSAVILDKPITLRGCGPGSTILSRATGPGSWSNQAACSSAGAWGATIGCSNAGNNPSPAIIVSPLGRFVANPLTGCALTADGAQGATSVSVTSSCASNFAPGQIVLLDETTGASFLPDFEHPTTNIWRASDFRVVFRIHNPPVAGDDCSGANPPTPSNCSELKDFTFNPDRMTNEIKQITSVSGTTITFDSPLTISYRTSHSGELWGWATAPLRQAGIENLTVQFPDDNAIEWDEAAYSWAKNVELVSWLGRGFELNGCFRCQLDTVYVHDGAWCVPGSGGYNIGIDFASSENLITNSISIRCNKVMVARAAGTGTVVSYNYIDMGYIAGQGGWSEIGLNGSHLVGSHHMLFEGNAGWNIDSDSTHGGSDYHSFYRNLVPGIRATFTGEDGVVRNDSLNCLSGTTDGPFRTVGPHVYSWWFSVLYNVLGQSGCSDNWTLDAVYGGSPAPPGIRMLGWDDEFSGYTGDPNVQTIYPNVGPNCSASAPICSLIYGGNWAYNVNVTNNTPPVASPSFYLPGRPTFFNAGSGYPWPWVTPDQAAKSQAGPAGCAGTCSGLPALARWQAGTPFVQP